MQRALLAGLVIALICPAIGVFLIAVVVTWLLLAVMVNLYVKKLSTTRKVG